MKAEKARNEVPEGCQLSSQGLAEQEAIFFTCMLNAGFMY